METDIVRKIKRVVQKAYPDAYVRKLADQMSRGLPDLLIVVGGKLLFVEVKDAEGQATPIQLHEHRQIRLAGGNVILARSAEEVLAELERMVG